MAKGRRGRVGGAGIAALLALQFIGTTNIAEAQSAAQSSVSFDIAPKPVHEALVDFARQAGLRLVLSTPTRGATVSNRVAGAMAPDLALQRLIVGTGYSARIEGGAIVVEAPDRPGRRAELGAVQLAQAPSATQTDGRVAEEVGASDLVITGTSIRGVHPGSTPVQVVTAEQIARSGAMTTEQFLQKLPQNLASRSAFDGGAVPEPNRESVSAIDLRGLGLGSTLVLLNGRRLGLSASGQAADISFIPLAAVSRVEIVTDGASAIYGSDAIGGVVNFILRDDFEGAETRLSYGGVSDGNYRQSQVSQTVGAAWNGGRALGAVSFLSADPLRREDRSFALAAGPGELTPHDRRWSALVSFAQDVAGLSFEGDLMAATRDVKSDFAGRNFRTLGEYSWSRAETDQVQVNLAGSYDLGESLRARLAASFADVESRVEGSTLFRSVGLGPFLLPHNTSYQAIDLTATLDGVLFESRAGEARFAIGAGVTDEDYVASRTLTGVNSRRPLARRTTYGFGELDLPLVGPMSETPFVNRFGLNLALRYTQYEDRSAPSANQDFGGDFSPKVGVLWGVFEGLDLRATYGESFRAPALTQIDPSTKLHNIADRAVGGVASRLVVVEGPMTDLRPETARTYTIGLDWRPAERLSFALTYFNIDYTDRIARGDPTGGSASIANPAQFPEVMIRRPSAATIAEALQWGVLSGSGLGLNLADIAGTSALLAAHPNIWLLDNRTRNLAQSRVDGLDVSARYALALGAGDLSLNGQITRIFDYAQRAQPASADLTIVDTALRPVDLRARFDAAYVNGPLLAALGVSYVDDYANPFAVGGAQPIDSWTTIDATFGYDFGARRDIRMRLSVQNLLDEAPPLVASSGPEGVAVRAPVGYDPANANPLGRLISLELIKRW